MNRNYKVIKEGDRYTIGEWDEGYQAFIVNDGICQYYWWSSAEDAQQAADAYNAYEGAEWLGQHGYGGDRISRSEINDDNENSEIVNLYSLFGAIDDD